ncbi:MAG: CxxxxCH/CxxCH domain-containing protein [Myxococcales bacterium]|nr:CxxxxCH/CxxCH domain-containing protein [Myxococcales bacterium]
MIQVWAISFLSGCFVMDLFDKEEPGEPPPFIVEPEGEPPYGGGFLVGQFCDVQSVFQVSCVVGCHSGLVPGGGLDLDTDPYGSIVNQVGGTGLVLVNPGYADQSFLYRKMLGNLQVGEGAPMPTAGVLDPVFTDVIYRWIQNGAPNDCEQVQTVPTDYTVDEPYHPPGWEEPEVHGVAANLQTDGDCRACHGPDLTGGIDGTNGPSCDGCHEPDWRQDCVYCHGGGDNLTGAPPQDIDNSPVSLAFPPHTEHVTGGLAYDHPAYGCTTCHAQRLDVLTPGHIFDDVTAGYGELDYTQGLSPYGTYLFGTCSNLYCHGNGLADNGEVTVGDTMYCYSCHPDGLNSGAAEWLQMSGQHADHMVEAEAQCYECHTQTTDAAQAILNGDYHVNGTVEVLPNGVVYNGFTCTGVCHEHEHENDSWE